MKKSCLLSFVLFPLFTLFAFGPGGGAGGGDPWGGNPGGGGWQPGGGGNQPDMPGGGGAGNTFVYDTFLTDSSTSGGCIVYGTLMTGYVAGRTEIVVPATVTEIADGALAGNGDVTSIDATAATGLTAVPDSFAAGCSALTEVTLPSTVARIGASAFAMDAALETVYGDGVAEVGDYAFYGCLQQELSEATFFVVTFDANGGACGTTSVRVEEGGTLAELPSATRSGYDFVGWFDSAEGGTAVLAGVAVTSNVTAYAQWEKQPEPQVVAGVAVSFQAVEMTDGDGATWSVKGLPSGLKFAAKDVIDATYGAIAAGTVYGVPTKSGTYALTFTKKVGKEKQVTTKTLVVEGLPSWAVGTFNGLLEDGSGSATLTVAATGKASGKVVASGKTWSFSAQGFETSEGSSDGVTELKLSAQAKSGKETRVVSLVITEGGATGAVDGDGALTLWRNAWKDKGATDVLTPFVGLYTVQLLCDETGTGYLSLKIDAKGNCKATGKFPDGTSASSSLPLVWDGTAQAPFAVWQTSPSAYKGGCVGGILRWTAEKDVTADGVLWTSQAPAATETYGDGFRRELSATGAWYGQEDNLSEYLSSLTFDAEAPEDDVVVSNVRLSGFAKATGVFKGTLACLSKKANYEGVVVRGEPARGHYLWSRTGSYEDGKTGKRKTYAYKTSHPVVFMVE